MVRARRRGERGWGTGRERKGAGRRRRRAGNRSVKAADRDASASKRASDGRRRCRRNVSLNAEGLDDDRDADSERARGFSSPSGRRRGEGLKRCRIAPRMAGDRSGHLRQSRATPPWTRNGQGDVLDVNVPAGTTLTKEGHLGDAIVCRACGGEFVARPMTPPDGDLQSGRSPRVTWSD